MTRRDAILLAAGSTAALSSTLAAGILWLILSNPLAVAHAAVTRELAGQGNVAAAVLYDMLLHLVHLL